MFSTRFRKTLRSALLGATVVLGHSAVAGELSDSVAANDLTQVNTLLASGADVNEPSRFGTPLHIASDLGAVEVMAALIAAGADIEAEGRGGAHPLHLAATKDHSAAVTLLIEHGATVDSRDSFGFTPLMAALAFPPEGFDAAEALIAAGADLNARDAIENTTALHFAAYRSRLEVARFLIANGVDVSIRDGMECTPLHYAVVSRSTEMIGFLVESGADINAVDKKGDTPVQLAQGNAEITKLLQRP